MFINRSPSVQDSSQNKKTKRKLQPSLLIFFFFNLFIGFNLGFTKYLKKQARPFVTIVQVLVIIVVTAIMAVPLGAYMGAIFKNLVSVQYFVYAIILQLSNYNLYDLIQDIHRLNKNIVPPKVENKIGVSATIWSLIWFLSKASMCIVHCLYAIKRCVYYTIPGYITCVLSLLVDGTVIIEVCIYYYIYRSVKYLNEYLEGSKIDIQYVSDFYIALADCYNKIMPLYGRLIFVEVIVTVPQLLAMIWHLVSALRETHDWLYYLFEAVFVCHVIIKFCGPAITAEMSNSEMEDIKRKLHDMRVFTENQELQTEVLHLLHYMDTRTLQYRLCHIIPVDLRLVVSMFSVITTYCIVLLQFTHLV